MAGKPARKRQRTITEGKPEQIGPALVEISEDRVRVVVDGVTVDVRKKRRHARQVRATVTETGW